jgi:hypothetical protein
MQETLTYLSFVCQPPFEGCKNRPQLETVDVFLTACPTPPADYPPFPKAGGNCSSKTMIFAQLRRRGGQEHIFPLDADEVG